MENPHSKPVIGVSNFYFGRGQQLLDSLLAQIEEAGAVPLFLGNHANRNAADDIKKIDALIVMGNDGDIDPDDYGQAPHPATTSERMDYEGCARADYEYELLALARDMRMPTYGICGGMQRLNVLQKGTLHQHLPDIVGHDEHDQRPFGPMPSTAVEPIRFATGSKLRSITDMRSMYMPDHQGDVVMENSCHHQAVDKVGEGLIASAFSQDEYETVPGEKRHLVEGIEPDPNGPLHDWPMVAVQFHPEAKASHIGDSMIQWFMQEAITFANPPGQPEKNRVHPEDEADLESEMSRTFHNAPSTPRTCVEQQPKRFRGEDSVLAKLSASTAPTGTIRA